jgi:uncharacterized protein YyaL (SSP411 family)
VTSLLNHYTGETRYRDMAQHAIRYLAAPAVSGNHGYQVAGILLADQELGTPPLHLTVVGKKDDPAAQKLFQTAIAQPATYKRVEWWDRREGALPHADVPYPELDEAAAFICTNRSCSPPIFDPSKISAFATKRK